MRKLIAILLMLPPLGAAAADAPSAERRAELTRLVRQDCGSCHGMRLTGGLGSPLTAESLRDKPLEGLVATVLYGRPGTAMPPWRGMLSDGEAQWIVGRLMAGFPEETR
ncbi:MAG: c-type cytochrome [Ignavibacteria bacterium]